jgi:ppGpp synthetase/RelA/SpoT-type nucleotidyltranferase
MTKNGSLDSWVRNYEIGRPKFETYCTDIQRIIEGILEDNGINIHSIECRAKSIESYRKKILKLDKTGLPKYSNPLIDITDLAAVRVIVFTTSYVKTVCDIVEQNFAVSEKKDLGEERSDSKNFGYQSVHYLVSHTDDRLKLSDYKKFGKMICEVQVRTILQHAWAQIEHDIQYKSDNEIPKEIGRKFRALAGLIEIADREFQSIQDSDLQLKDAIQTSAADQLTKDTINQLNAEAGELAAVKSIGDQETEASIKYLSSAREFILQGKYEDALKIFNQNLAQFPNSHAHYIGRAKVRFLLGDRSGALGDLNEAERLNPDGPGLAVVRSQIEQGNPKTQFAEISASDEYRLGGRSLAEGKGEAAFIHFSNAQEGGHNLIFSVFSKAMACVLAGDLKGARAFLNQLSRRPDTPMEINIVALSCIADLLDNIDIAAKLKELKALLKRMPDFSLQISPLNNLLSGLAKRSGSTQADAIFDLLNRK